jgi:hypothetical protein
MRSYPDCRSLINWDIVPLSKQAESSFDFRMKHPGARSGGRRVEAEGRGLRRTNFTISLYSLRYLSSYPAMRDEGWTHFTCFRISEHGTCFVQSGLEHPSLRALPQIKLKPDSSLQGRWWMFNMVRRRLKVQGPWVKVKTE